MWDLKTGQLTHSLSEHKAPIMCVNIGQTFSSNLDENGNFVENSSFQSEETIDLVATGANDW